MANLEYPLKMCLCVSVHAGGCCCIALYIFMASTNRQLRLKKKHFLKIIYSVYAINTNTQFCKELRVKELRGKSMVCCPVNYSSIFS